jgi:YD repeat-containing protein
MTSSTDAKGMTTYYEYDAFQRLKTIKDQNGNILKQTDYHYKN